jgi:hypothetical protein
MKQKTTRTRSTKISIWMRPEVSKRLWRFLDLRGFTRDAYIERVITRDMDKEETRFANHLRG